MPQGTTNTLYPSNITNELDEIAGLGFLQNSTQHINIGISVGQSEDLSMEQIIWDGGENHFDGEHHGFCYVCGGTMELFGCQTCDTCYHASCMSPTLEPTEVPPFWFCPHCIDRDFHIPSMELSETTEPSPSIEVIRVYPSPSSTEVTSTEVLSNVGPERPVPQSNSIPQYVAAGGNHKIGGNKPLDSASLSRRQNLASIDQIQDLAHNLKKTKAPVKQMKRSYSPPRKRSKYSAFSSEVDKALAVITKELEKAAKVGKSEDSLRNRIQDLEQQLRLKDGQIMLTRRELELAKNENGQSCQLKAELLDMQQQNAMLKTQVDRKDSELKDWREKLKSLLGNAMEIS